MLAGNATFSVVNPRHVFTDNDSPSSGPQMTGLIPRKRSVFQSEMSKKPVFDNDERRYKVTDGTDESGGGSSDNHPGGHRRRIPRSGRPKGAKRRASSDRELTEQTDDEPQTPWVSEEHSSEDARDIIINPHKGKEMVEDEPHSHANKSTRKHGHEGRPRQRKGPMTSTPKTSPLSPSNRPLSPSNSKNANKNKDETPIRPDKIMKRKVSEKKDKFRTVVAKTKQSVDGKKGKQHREPHIDETTDATSTDGDTGHDGTNRKPIRAENRRKAVGAVEDSSMELGKTSKKFKQQRYKSEDYTNSKLRERTENDKESETGTSDMNGVDDCKTERCKKRGDRKKENTKVTGSDRRKKSSSSAITDPYKVFYCLSSSGCVSIVIFYQVYRVYCCCFVSIAIFFRFMYFTFLFVEWNRFSLKC